MSAVSEATQRTSPFANRSFACLFASQAVTQFGDWFRTIALISIVYRLMPGSVSLGGLFLATALPMLCSCFFRGLKRMNKKRLLLLGDVLHAFLVLGMIAGAKAGHLWVVYVCVAGSSLLLAAFGSARAAMVPELLAATQLKQVSGCYGLLHQAAMLMGSGAAALLIGPMGATGLLLFDAGCYWVSALCMACIRYMPDAEERATPRVSKWQEIREGLAVVRTKPQLVGLFGAQVWRDVVSGYVTILFSLYLLRDLQAGASGVGVGYAVTAIGYALGLFAVQRTFRKRAFDLKLYAPYLMIYGIGLGVMYRVHSVFLFLGVLLLSCVFLAGVNTMSEMALLSYAKAEARGSVVAAWLFVSRLTYALSLLLFMWISDLVPVTWMAVLLVTAALFAQRKTTRS